MRLWQIGLAAMLVLWGAVLAYQANSRADAVGAAERNSRLVSAAQEIRAELGRADAAAINGFLAGGGEQPEQRAAYVQAIEEAATTLQDAARFADSSDARTAVETLQKQLPTYTGLIETARANNRQNLPVGAAYLRTASNLVRNEMAVQTEQLRVAGDLGFRDRTSALVGGIDLLSLAATALALGAVAVTTRWLSRRTNRTLNPGLVAAAALVAGGLMYAGNSVNSTANSGVSAFRDGYDRLASLAELRADAYDQKALATFALVDRGARNDIYAAADTEANNVVARLDASALARDLAEVWTPYAGAAEEVVRLDRAGDYEAARELITAQEGGPNSAFEDFDGRLISLTDTATSQLDANLADARGPLQTLRWLALGLGVAAAGAASWGIQRRINEYR
jgi:hypothetical protein